MNPADKDPFKKIFHKKNNEKFEFLFAGDLSFGENYQQRIKEQGGESILETQGYDYGLEKLKPLMTNADFVVVNLETPITDLKNSPFAEQKSYIHWTDTEKTPKALIDHNVSLVSLANNHSFDYGQEGYDQTMQILKKYDLPVIGAGDNIDKASQPYICEINFEVKKIKIAIIAAFEEVGSYRNKYKVYAENKKSGLMPLDMDCISNKVKKIKTADPEIFIIFFPHWGDNYQWCDQEQITLSNSLFSCGVDLIIGHGAHMMQEFEQHHDKLVLYNIGNFMFHSPGRYQKMQAPPYSAAVSLTVKLVNNQFDIGLKLYPIVSDNKITNYQPRMANKTELEDLLKALSQRKIMQSSHLLETKKDQFGYYFEFSNLKERFIGMMYHHKYETQIKTDKFVLLPQILVITNEFKKHNYKLVCYSPTNVNKIDNTVTGYILENTPTNHILGKNKFKQICTSIPNVNHDFYFGSDNLNHYRDFMSWALNHKYKIYPTKAITKLTQDKLLTAQILSKFNKSIIPYTESFNGNIAQLQKYLQQTSAVFIKPQYGRMGNKIFVVRFENDMFIAEYYLRQEKTITSFATLKTCLAHVNKLIDEEYIIQEAIDVMQYDNQVFAIRAIAFNTGQKWLCLTEVRISNKSNAVSNGGSFEVTLDFLLKILPQKEAFALLEKIKKDTIDLTMKINSEYDDTIVELAFDVLVDKKGNIYIAEINIKPGLTGINLDNTPVRDKQYIKSL